MTTAALRYSDRPTGWRTRATGAGGTVGLFMLLAAVMLVTWRIVQPMAAPVAMIAINLDREEAPPEPMREVPEGPHQVEQQERQIVEPERRDPLPDIVLPRLSPVTQPVNPPVPPVAPADPVPETTAPRSTPAPPARQVSSAQDASWEALVMAQLERHRRYPAAARARRLQGVAHVTFRMNRAGRVLASRVSRSAGAAMLDRAALDTLQRAQPLPAIPDDRPDEIELTVQVEFFTG
ncbi:TonB family protein [Altererythrobacter xixiisoli]|uniref:TonB family protein n=1 Tax=Croceibacterium xixiisoli TaxID=1476466 RepID=A0A6I4TTQ5_9SPHN|nr:energy transducer TonB [Croceibacterium xixiisoli]MXO99575.1 TonB family protein [Croceibacterium xixiisoli]